MNIYLMEDAVDSLFKILDKTYNLEAQDIYFDLASSDDLHFAACRVSP